MREARQKLEEALDVGLDTSSGLRWDRRGSNSAVVPTSSISASSYLAGRWPQYTKREGVSVSWRTEDVKHTN
jgi:hypothetical protein